MILLDYKDRRPLYEQVAERFKELMIRGGLEENAQMPSVRSLATDLAINPNTIQRAYAQLEREGYIYSIKGKGSFVADHDRLREGRRMEWREELNRLIAEAQRIGIHDQEIWETVREALAPAGSVSSSKDCREHGKEDSGYDRSDQSDETV